MAPKVELTPLDIVQEKYSVLCKDIPRISQKFNQRWPDIDRSWPLEGSFDTEVINNIKVLVHGYSRSENKGAKTETQN